MHCKFCGQPLPDVKTGRRPREYCSGAHRQAYYRQTHQAHPTADHQADLATMQEALEEARQRIADLELENMRLRNKLDIERRYLEDQQKRSFLAWLKKQESPLKEKIAGDVLFPPRDIRTHYEYRLRYLLHCSEEEMREFERLWKLMLLS